ncbi:hypothetical protein MKX03_004747 [Papaver bracteatum]|nr:hypothetical protein MKX03_004747 [Papaver bracteatum]
MAQLHKLGFETEVKCNADKYFGMYSHNVSQLPRFFPNIFKSIEVIEGDETRGKEMATKERLTAFDKEKKSITFEMLEGEVMNYYKALSAKLDVMPKQCAAVNGSLVKWSLEFEKVNDDIPNPTAYIDLLQYITKELSSQLC